MKQTKQWSNTVATVTDIYAATYLEQNDQVCNFANVGKRGIGRTIQHFCAYRLRSSTTLTDISDRFQACSA
jgi:hypothetical protein